MRPLAKPVDDTVTYCTVEDVNRYIRGFDLTDDQREPTSTTVEAEIQAETDAVEKYLEHMAFREMKVEDYVIDDDVFNSSQKRKKLGYEKFTQPYVENTSTSNRVNYNLRFNNIRSISKLETYTNDDTKKVIIDDSEGIDKTDLYTLENTNGFLKLDLNAFDRNRAKEHGSIYKDARINISFTYGYDYVPNDISRATAQRVAGIIVSTDAYSKTLDDDFSGVEPNAMKNELFKKANSVLDQYVKQYK